MGLKHSAAEQACLDGLQQSGAEQAWLHSVLPFMKHVLAGYAAYMRNHLPSLRYLASIGDSYAVIGINVVLCYCFKLAVVLHRPTTWQVNSISNSHYMQKASWIGKNDAPGRYQYNVIYLICSRHYFPGKS